MRRPALEQLPRLSLALLVAAIASMAALLLELHSSARAHRATAQRALRVYAAIAAEELGAQLREELRASQFAAFIGVAREVERRGADRPLRPAEVRALVLAQDSTCRCTPELDLALRYDFGDGTLVMDGTDVDARWRAGLDSAIPRRVLRADAPPRTVRASAARTANLALPLTSRAPATLLIGEGDRERLVMIEIFHGVDGSPVIAYGVALRPDSLLATIAARVLRRYPLLPGALRDLPNDSVLTTEVRTPAGRVAFASGGSMPDSRGLERTPYVARDTMSGALGALRLAVALRPSVAESLLLGGFPTSRFPIVVVLFGLTVAVGAAFAVLFRRQEELVRSRAEFVSGVSHELRTPLSQIRLLAELLSLGLPASEAGRRRSAKIIDQEARRLTHLVDNVLQYSATERGLVVVRPAPADLGHEVALTMSTFAPLLQSESARVRMDLAPGVTALVDTATLRQVVLNLLDNALRYGPPGQTLDVAVRRHGEWARLSIGDEGPGIPESERGRVWRPYYRIPREDDPTRGGSGLGLAVVREAVLAHRGRCTIGTAPGGGARFDIDFPLATTASPVAVPGDNHLDTRPPATWPVSSS